MPQHRNTTGAPRALHSPPSNYHLSSPLRRRPPNHPPSPDLQSCRGGFGYAGAAFFSGNHDHGVDFRQFPRGSEPLAWLSTADVPSTVLPVSGRPMNRYSVDFIISPAIYLVNHGVNKVSITAYQESCINAVHIDVIL